MPKGNSTELRRKARSLALQALYEADIAGHPVDGCFGWLKDEAGLPSISLDFAVELVEGVMGRRDEVDIAIHKFAPAWPVKQLPVVDRNILRLALFELMFGRRVPHKVAINEAVELAKTFGGESSPRFVNGVLGSVMDDIEGASAEEAEVETDIISREWK